MADNKKAFILYADLIHVVRKLVEQDRKDKTNHAGELFLHILEYVNDLNPIPINFIVDMAAEPIKQQLKRDLQKWEVKSERRSEAGKKGGIKSGEVRKQNEAKEANASNVKQSETNEAVTVTDTVNVTVTDTVTDNTSYGSMEEPPHEIFSKKILSSSGEMERQAIQTQCRVRITEEMLRDFSANLTLKGKKHDHWSEWVSHLRNWILAKPPDKPLQKQKTADKQLLSKTEKAIATNAAARDIILKKFEKEIENGSTISHFAEA